MIDGLGWIATGLVVGSYFTAKVDRLRLFQMCGAVVWAVYGALIASWPVVIANVLVFAAAALTKQKG